jgi:Rrf2 family protein
VKLSKTSAHAALAVAYLAHCPTGRIVQARQVADHLGVPVDSALKVLQNLARRGIIHSQLGRGGGYHLGRRPEQISLLQVIEATDGPIDAEVPLPQDQGCAPGLEMLETVCRHIADRTRADLAATSIADLARVQRPLSLPPAAEPLATVA